MIAVALWVAHLPGAVGRMPAFGIGPLLLGTAGLVLLCLLRTPLRWSGAVVAAGRDRLGRWRRRSPTCWLPPTARRWRCAAPTAGSRPAHRPRHLRRQGMARRRRRRATAQDDKSLRRRRPLRRGRLHRQARRRPLGIAWPLAHRGIRRGLRARRGGDHEPRSARRLHATADRPRGLADATARSRCAGPATVFADASRGPPARTGHGRIAPTSHAANRPTPARASRRATPTPRQRRS